PRLSAKQRNSKNATASFKPTSTS
ncbi:cysteine-rich domain protein, partial [Vibrio parahaemolyticus V-223/04]